MDDKIIEIKDASAVVVEEDPKPMLSPEEIVKTSAEFSEDLVLYMNEKISGYAQPFPVAIILNSLMYIYVSTVINSIPKEMRRAITEDHFSKVLKDLETNGQIEPANPAKPTEQNP